MGSKKSVDDLSGWLDNDRDALSQLDAAERIEYFEKRVRLVAIHPLERLLKSKNEIDCPQESSSALLICGVSLCCAVEATGKFLCGTGSANGDRFCAFLEKYMSADYQTKKIGNRTYGQRLWKDFRNGLAHGFAVCHGGFDRNKDDDNNDNYFSTKKIAGKESLMVNPYWLYDDYANGFCRYLCDLRADQPNGSLFQKFNDVFESVFINGE